MHPSNSSLANGLRPAIIALRTLPRRAAHMVIRAYQLTFSALVGRQCRHAPSCSAYMDEAIERHGVWAGGLLGLARVCRCHPWGTSGYDPVPEHLPNRSLSSSSMACGADDKKAIPSVRKAEIESQTSMTGNPRVADYPIDRQFIERWSPRAFTGEPVPEYDLHTMFEAARWAPSSSNRQPWRFLYALGGTPDFDKFLALLNESNRVWAKKAGALVILISKTTAPVTGTDKVVPSRTHSFDAGASWAYLALEALHLGYAAHGMAGFDVARTIVDLKIPDDYRPEVAIAVGRRGDASLLPEHLREREIPSKRHPQKDFVFAGGFSST